jgi:hypothetical protein
MSEEQILHSASSIIRSDIESLDIEHEFYPNASDVSLGTSLEKIIRCKSPIFQVLHFMHSYTCKIAPNFGI